MFMFLKKIKRIIYNLKVPLKLTIMYIISHQNKYNGPITHNDYILIHCICRATTGFWGAENGSGSCGTHVKWPPLWQPCLPKIYRGGPDMNQIRLPIKFIRVITFIHSTFKNTYNLLFHDIIRWLTFLALSTSKRSQDFKNMILK